MLCAVVKSFIVREYYNQSFLITDHAFKSVLIDQIFFNCPVTFVKLKFRLKKPTKTKQLYWYEEKLTVVESL